MSALLLPRPLTMHRSASLLQLRLQLRLLLPPPRRAVERHEDYTVLGCLIALGTARDANSQRTSAHREGGGGRQGAIPAHRALNVCGAALGTTTTKSAGHR